MGIGPGFPLIMGPGRDPTRVRQKVNAIWLHVAQVGGLVCKSTTFCSSKKLLVSLPVYGSFLSILTRLARGEVGEHLLVELRRQLLF